MIRRGSLDNSPVRGLGSLQEGGMASYAFRTGPGVYGLGSFYYGPPHVLWWSILPLFILLGWSSAMAYAAWAVF